MNSLLLFDRLPTGVLLAAGAVALLVFGLFPAAWLWYWRTFRRRKK